MCWKLPLGTWRQSEPGFSRAARRKLAVRLSLARVLSLEALQCPAPDLETGHFIVETREWLRMGQRPLSLNAVCRKSLRFGSNTRTRENSKLNTSLTSLTGDMSSWWEVLFQCSQKYWRATVSLVLGSQRGPTRSATL